MKSPTVQPSQICVEKAIGVSSKRKPQWLAASATSLLHLIVWLADCQIETSQRGRGTSPSIFKIFQKGKLEQKQQVFKKYFSIPVLRSAVLIPRLEIVVLLAEALPVRPIPEQLLVSTVRDDRTFLLPLCGVNPSIYKIFQRLFWGQPKKYFNTCIPACCAHSRSWENAAACRQIGTSQRGRGKRPSIYKIFQR